MKFGLEELQSRHGHGTPIADAEQRLVFVISTHRRSVDAVGKALNMYALGSSPSPLLMRYWRGD